MEESQRYVGIFLLRVFLAARLIYGVVDNILHWEKMVEFSYFLESNGFPFPLWSAIISVYAQFFGALSLLIGFRVRLFSFLLITNFAVAILFVHIAGNDSVEATTPALAMFFGCLTIYFTGADKLSVDYFLKRRERESERDSI